MSCCNSTDFLDLGCYGSCRTVVLDPILTVTGLYTVYWTSPGGRDAAMSISGTVGSYLELPLSNFLESGITNFNIVDPNGDDFGIVYLGTTYLCFKIRTKIIYGETADETPPSSECCSYILLEVDGASSRVVAAAEWNTLGVAIPTFTVMLNDGSGYTTQPIEAVFDSLPNPTTATISIGGIPASVWYIKITV